MARTAQARGTERKNFMARIHIAKKELALDDDSYRSIISSVSPGKTSAKELTMKELAALIEAFKTKGWKPKRPARKKGIDTAATDFRAKRIWLIKKIWGNLENAGVLNDPTQAGLEKYCTKYMLGDKLEWASSDELNSIVSALKGWERRVNMSQPKEDLNRA